MACIVAATRDWETGTDLACTLSQCPIARPKRLGEGKVTIWYKLGVLMKTVGLLLVSQTRLFQPQKFSSEMYMESSKS